MPRSFIEVEINADHDLVDQLVGILSQLGFEGFWEDGDILKCYISGGRWIPSMQEEIQSIVSRMNRPSSSRAPRIAVQLLEDKNWKEEWEKTIRPIQVTERIVIKPTWHEYTPTPGQVVITIDPKMAFGTGYHETTRLVLRLMEKHVQKGMKVLDVGTGTGVLAIAGAVLGASAVVGVDIDEWSYDNAVENVDLNRVEDRVKILQGDLSSLPPERFDMIVANIQLNVIDQMLPDIRERLNTGGVLLLSGLLLIDREHILGALAGYGFTVSEETKENEWLAVAARLT